MESYSVNNVSTSYDIETYTIPVKDGVITLPDELTEKLGWNVGDDISFEETEVCEDSGEYNSVYLRNITKEERMQTVKLKGDLV
jgi:bifunctional DNA-binding transcriptional regulator/antitoxin component of YhaV-PrlF toxin-antitoxin module